MARIARIHTTLAYEDMTYITHGREEYQLRLFRPEGTGPFPFVVDLHGGAWNLSDRMSGTMRAESFVPQGIASASLDFRHGQHGYPTSLQDANYAIRWLKSNAKKLRLDPERVGLVGASSGGHLAMLAAMRPGDTRYGALESAELDAAFDARVRCVGMVAPVINPLSRYRRAMKAAQAPNPPEWAVSMVEKHLIYWTDDTRMAEGNPLLILERNEEAELPPAIYIQGRPDSAHIYVDPDRGGDELEPDRFVRNYRGRGGEIDLVWIETEEAQSPLLYDPLATFVANKLR